LAAKRSWRCRTAAASLRDRPEACASRLSLVFQTAPPVARHFHLKLGSFASAIGLQRSITFPPPFDGCSAVPHLRRSAFFTPAYPRLRRRANFCRALGAEFVSSGDCSNEARTEPRADRFTLQLNTESEREAERRRGTTKEMQPQRRRVGRENNRSRDRAPFGGDEDSVSAVALGAGLGREFNGPEAWGGAQEFEAY
jgi:hypothetical protein